MDRRLFLLPVAATVIAASVIWRLDQEEIRRSRHRPAVASVQNLLPAPGFALANQSGAQTKLGAYLGRTRVVLGFTGAIESLEGDSGFRALINAQPALAAAGLQLLIVTPLPPQAVRKAQEAGGKPLAFPVLSDIDISGGIPTPVHQQWGLVDKPGEPARAGLFLIDRAGLTEFTSGDSKRAARPRSLEYSAEVIAKLAKGESP